MLSLCECGEASAVNHACRTSPVVARVLTPIITARYQIISNPSTHFLPFSSFSMSLASLFCDSSEILLPTLALRPPRVSTGRARSSVPYSWRQLHARTKLSPVRPSSIHFHSSICCGDTHHACVIKIPEVLMYLHLYSLHPGLFFLCRACSHSCVVFIIFVVCAAARVFVSLITHVGSRLVSPNYPATSIIKHKHISDVFADCCVKCAFLFHRTQPLTQLLPSDTFCVFVVFCLVAFVSTQLSGPIDNTGVITSPQLTLSCAKTPQASAKHRSLFCFIVFLDASVNTARAG